jgi:ribosomal protein S18 acetylase RimI-like enzyme
MMQSDFEIRRWVKAERLDELLGVVHDAFRELDPPSSVLNETPADLAARFDRETFLVALSGETIVGSVFCARKDEALYLTRLAVLPSWRRRGVGRALMQAAEEEARRVGARRLTLRVRKTLPANLGYFRALGFAVTGEGREPGRTPYDTMAHTLDESRAP